MNSSSSVRLPLYVASAASTYKWKEWVLKENGHTNVYTSYFLQLSGATNKQRCYSREQTDMQRGCTSRTDLWTLILPHHRLSIDHTHKPYGPLLAGIWLPLDVGAVLLLQWGCPDWAVDLSVSSPGWDELGLWRLRGPLFMRRLVHTGGTGSTSWLFGLPKVGE